MGQHTDEHNTPRHLRWLVPSSTLLWLALAWGARRYAETDLVGWQVAEWIAHQGKWIVFALAGLGLTVVSVIKDRARLNWPRAVQVLLICGVILGLTLWRTLPVHFFLDQESTWGEHGELLQSVEYTCAPVSLGNLLLLRRMQLGVNERELALLSGTTVEGTPLYNLIWAAECFGLRVRSCRKMTLAELEQAGGPALVTISTVPSVRHMTLLLRFSKRGVHFLDPAYGHRTISRERFESIWYGKTLVLR